MQILPPLCTPPTHHCCTWQSTFRFQKVANLHFEEKGTQLAEAHNTHVLTAGVVWPKCCIFNLYLSGATTPIKQLCVPVSGSVYMSEHEQWPTGGAVAPLTSDGSDFFLLHVTTHSHSQVALLKIVLTHSTRVNVLVTFHHWGGGRCLRCEQQKRYS